MPSSSSSSPPGGFPPPTEPLAVLSALLGGGRYGLKIRLPHALVMTALFRRELSAREKLRSILKLSAEHATNLAAFAAIYKTVLAALKLAAKYDRDHSRIDDRRKGVLQTLGQTIVRLIVGSPPPLQAGQGCPPPPRGPGLPDRPLHSLLAGAVGGYLVWGRYSSVNYQIVLYLFGRVVVGALSLARERGVPPFCWDGLRFRRSYRLGAAAVWGVVMVLFEEYPHVLHPSLRRSMDEIYRYVPRFWGGGGRGTEDGGAVRRGAAPPPSRRLESATTIDFSIEDATM